MSKFDEIMENYKINVLEEQPPVEPAPATSARSAPAPAPAPDIGGDPTTSAGGPAAEPEAPDPKDIVDELEKSSKKPWIDIAGVLARAIEYTWSDDDIKAINESLPGGLAIKDFIDVRSSPKIKDKYDENIVSASITLFDVVDRIMNKNNMGEVVPAEER